MASIAINAEKELTGRGQYLNTGLWYGAPYAPVEKLSPPITPAENMFRYYKGEDYEWIPDICSDEIDITPECNPDFVASGFEGGRDVFNVKWVPVEGGELPAFVEPGFILWDDISRWRECEFPDPDAWDWETEAKAFNEAHKDDDRARRGIISSGYFERLIANLGFEEAAACLLTDPEEVSAFFEKLTDLNINIMNHMIDDFGCQLIMIHDDWASQRSPFFSLNTVMELFVPHLKRLSDAAHERGVFITLHSCGNGTDLIPAMKAAGVDGWQAQNTAVDMDKAIDECGSDLIFETYPDVPEGISGAEHEAFIRDTLEKYCAGKRCLLDIYDFDPERLPETRRLIYKISRQIALAK